MTKILQGMPEGKVLIRYFKQQQHLENHQFI